MKLNYVINKKKFEIVLLDNTEFLYNYLNEMGIIERIKGISQLGTIKVPKRLRKSKFDYIMYQLYLISILSGESVRSKLKISTGKVISQSGLLMKNKNSAITANLHLCC